MKYPIVNWSLLDEKAKQQALARPAIADSATLSEQVASILDLVKTQGDKALYDLTGGHSTSTPNSDVSYKGFILLYA